MHGLSAPLQEEVSINIVNEIITYKESKDIRGEIEKRYNILTAPCGAKGSGNWNEDVREWQTLKIQPTSTRT